DVDRTIYQGCKLDTTLPYGVLLVRIGNDEPFKAIRRSGEFTADRDGFLEFRIHDADACLGDNAGSVTVNVIVKVDTIDLGHPWAGYAAGGPAHDTPINFKKVEASWIVPPINCIESIVSPNELVHSAYWVGLGG